jgi:FAD/FMN-containing dehydrogenase
VARDLTGWGRVFSPRHRVVGVRDRHAPLPASEDFLLPYGAGRSYGDSCLNDGHTVLHTRGLDRLVAFDPATGLLRCEAGVLLADIVDFALPRGWFLPVTPGTKFVTVGGAIANDVHGKNHHRDGSFGHHVPRLELLRSDGARLECGPERNADMFRATVGGLGLTGLVTWAEVQLVPVRGPWIRQTATRFVSLAQFFEASEALERAHRYVVAWLDCARQGEARGIIFAGDHDDDDNPVPARGTRAFPFEPPVSLVNGLTLRAFNALYYRTPRAGEGDPRLVPWDAFFYPLDSIRDWNRLYGPRGFYQYQCVVPPGEQGRAALAELLARIAASGQGSFLSVLKRFGERPAAGLMSFPMAGYTLALDFPNRGARTLALLETLDAVVLAAGGRVYPAKDARMSPASFRAYFPEWERFRDFIDPRFSSSFWRRVTQVPAMAVAA